MSTVVNAAFHTIRSARGAGGPPRPGIHKLKGIIPTPFCSPWRHPIWWWKFRHLRADICLLEDEIDPAVSRRMRELEDEAFLKGSGAIDPGKFQR